MAWLKLHTDILDDIKKVRKMDAVTFQNFIFLMLFAKELDQNGEINMTVEDISWRLRVNENTLKNSIEELVIFKILSKNAKGIVFVNWNKRQFSESYERVTRHRLKKRDGNTSVTPKVTIEQNRTDVTCVTETEQKQKKDREKEKKISNSENGSEFAATSESASTPPEPKKRNYKDPYCSTKWYLEVYAPMFEKETGGVVLKRSKEFGQAANFFKAVATLNPRASPKEIYERATRGVWLVFQGLAGEIDEFEWLIDCPADIGWFVSNAAKVDQALKRRESMTEEEIEREKEFNQTYEELGQIEERFNQDAEAKTQEQLGSSGRLPNPRPRD